MFCASTKTVYTFGMKILLLTTLFLAPLYYFTHEKTEAIPQIDLIEVKQSGPEREERILTTKEIVPTAIYKAETEATVEPKIPLIEDDQITEINLEHGEEVEINDLEQGWNTELKDMLGRLEPLEGEAIHKSYLSEQENYQAELDNLLSEKQQKTTDEAINEISNLIFELDTKHQMKLKEILGAHYEAVRDQYENFMDASSPAE